MIRFAVFDFQNFVASIHDEAAIMRNYQVRTFVTF